MNYIIQIKAFYDRLEINPLNASEIALWHALMSINNKTAWSDKFTVAASVLCQKAGIKDSSKSSNFFKSRNALAQAGLITWKSRKGNQAAEYSITKLYSDLSTYSVGNSVDSSVGSSVDNRVGNSVALNKHKLNKTKKNQEKSSRDDGSLESNFEKLWKLYPKKAGKKPAFNAYKRAIKKGVTNKQIQTGIVELIKHQKDKKYYPNGSTWFNQARWEDDYPDDSPEPPVLKKPVYSDAEQRSIDIMQAFSTHDHDAQQATQALQARYPDITLEAVERQVYPERFRKEDVF
ncbi:MAG: hypothetical protein LKJ60_10240 [Lentilactobacillus buchneri]|jgi:hypothetical protein|nr:hypothetical protein [Lentilactobacillus buchneri]